MYAKSAIGTSSKCLYYLWTSKGVKNLQKLVMVDAYTEMH